MTNKIFKKIFVFIFLLFLILGFKLPVVLAENEFATSYNTSYIVGTDGVTDVIQKITLKNLTKDYYATQFSLSIGSTKVTDVSATDQGGAMEIEQAQKNTSTSITVKFNQQIAGKDKENSFTLRFKSKDFTSRQGKIWEIYTPRIALSDNLENYSLTLSVPESFGEVTVILPKPISSSRSGGNQIYTFSKEQLLDSGVSASFGTMQVYDFNLNYPLTNYGPVSNLISIPLPPDTSYQNVIYTNINPTPINVTVDEDGNYLAWYKLSRSQKINVQVEGQARLFMTSQIKNPTLSTSLKLEYTKAQKYWETNHASVKSKLSEILKNTPPDLSNHEKAKLIYKAVVNSLKYDIERVRSNKLERFGAVTALVNPDSSVCQEFTDLFIALARAANIPSRELDGFAYSQNLELRPLSLSKDILHAWPEFWDEEKGWVMVDPTWENTTGGVDYFNKLDLSHFVFAIKGLSSTEPILGTKDVKVELTEKDFNLKPKLEVEIISPNPILAGFPNKLKIRIKNTGNSFQQNSAMSVSSGQITIIGKHNETGPIPAFGNAEFEYDLRTKTLLENYKDIIEVSVGGQKTKKEIEIKPFVIFRNFPLILISLIGLIGLIYFSVLGGLIIRRKVLKISSNVIPKPKKKKPAP